jgi:hypothetical protein
VTPTLEKPARQTRKIRQTRQDALRTRLVRSAAKSLLLAAAWTAAAAALSAEKSPLPAEKTEPPFVGETLHYAMTILGVAGGELTLSAQPAELAGRPAWKLELSAVSNDFLSKLFLVRDYMVSWVDPRTFRSLRFEKHTVEGKRVRDELTEFDYEKGVALVDEKGKNVRLEGATLDTLSSVYYLRTLPLDPGGEKPPVEMQVFSDEPRSLKVEVQGRERIATPAGTFSTIRVEPKSTGSSLIGKGKNLVLWLTDDERKVPVQIKSKLKVGTLVGKLKSIEGDASRRNTALTPAR